MSILNKINDSLARRNAERDSRIEYCIVRDTVSREITVKTSPRFYCEEFCKSANRYQKFERFVVELTPFEKNKIFHESTNSPFSYERERSGSNLAVRPVENKIEVDNFEAKTKKLLDKYFKHSQ